MSDDRATLQRLLAADDYLDIELQLWQEGVARFIEYAAARAAAGARDPSTEFRSLADYESYAQASDRALRGLRRELEQLDLAERRRVAFYPIGAAWALLLDQTRPDWKRVYARQPFTLPALVSAAR